MTGQSVDGIERPEGQVCPNPDCNIDQRWEGFRGVACPNCGVGLVVACSRCDSGAVYEDDEGTPYCSDHDPRQIVTDGGTVEGGMERPDKNSHPWNTMRDGPKGPVLCHFCDGTWAKLGPAERCRDCSLDTETEPEVEADDDAERFPNRVAWASLGMFVVGLYGGYTNGGAGGFLSVWLGAGGLMMAALAAEGGDYDE